VELRKRKDRLVDRGRKKEKFLSAESCSVNVLQRSLLVVGVCSEVYLNRRAKYLAQEANLARFQIQVMHEIKHTYP
jgi:hypothetical protein